MKINTFSVIMISIITSTIIEIFEGGNIDAFEILGSAFAFLLAPFLITCLIRHGIKTSLWKWNFEDKRFVRTFFILWGLWVLLNIIGSSPPPI